MTVFFINAVIKPEQGMRKLFCFIFKMVDFVGEKYVAYRYGARSVAFCLF